MLWGLSPADTLGLGSRARLWLAAHGLFYWEGCPMLALSRKPGESIYVGDDVVVTVSRIDGQKVVLTISAPTTTQILRDDAHKRTAREHTGGGKKLRLRACWN